MQTLMTRFMSRSEANIHTVTFTRSSYRPASVPELEFPPEERTVSVWTRDGETVEDVLKYHYGSGAQNIRLIQSQKIH